MPKIALALPALALVVACAQTPRDQARAAAEAERAEQDLSKELAGLTPGEPRGCLNTSETRNAQSRGYGTKIVYIVSPGVKYVTDAGPGCEGLGRRDDILVTTSPTGQLCRGDIARTIDRTSRFPTGSCAFGDFTPYRRP